MARILVSRSWLSGSVVRGVAALCLWCAGSSLAPAQEHVLQELYGRGVHAYFSQQFASAFEQLSAAIEQGTRDPRCFYYRGLALEKLGRPDEASADFRRGAELELTTDEQIYDISRSLQRVQGPERIKLEDSRHVVRVEMRKKKLEFERARYEQFKRAEERVLRKPQPAIAPAAPPADAPPADAPAKPAPADDPFGDAPAAKPAPAKPAPEKPAAEADPFGDEPAAPAKPAPAKPAAEADPFGDEPAAPAKPAPAKPAAEADPFGDEPAAPAKPAPAKPAPEADPFGDEPDADMPAKPTPAPPMPNPPKPAADADPFGDEPTLPPAKPKPAADADPFADDAPAEKPAAAPAPAPKPAPKPAPPADDDPFGA